MRINLDANGEVFAKQQAALRRHLDNLHLESGKAGVGARFMRATFLPYLVAVRTELRDEVVPQDVLDGVAVLLANIAKTAVQSLIQASPPVEGDTIEKLLIKACHIACQSLMDEAAASEVKGYKPPRLALVQPDGGATVIHLDQAKKGAK